MSIEVWEYLFSDVVGMLECNNGSMFTEKDIIYMTEVTKRLDSGARTVTEKYAVEYLISRLRRGGILNESD